MATALTKLIEILHLPLCLILLEINSWKVDFATTKPTTKFFNKLDVFLAQNWNQSEAPVRAPCDVRRVLSVAQYVDKLCTAQRRGVHKRVLHLCMPLLCTGIRGRMKMLHWNRKVPGGISTSWFSN